MPVNHFLFASKKLKIDGKVKCRRQPDFLYLVVEIALAAQFEFSGGLHAQTFACRISHRDLLYPFLFQRPSDQDIFPTSEILYWDHVQRPYVSLTHNDQLVRFCTWIILCRKFLSHASRAEKPIMQRFCMKICIKYTVIKTLEHFFPFRNPWCRYLVKRALAGVLCRGIAQQHNCDEIIYRVYRDVFQRLEALAQRSCMIFHRNLAGIFTHSFLCKDLAQGPLTGASRESFAGFCFGDFVRG